MVRLKGAGYYAVARGYHVGIYRSWPECQVQVKGFQNAKFKKFATEAEAQEYVNTHAVTKVNFMGDPSNGRPSSAQQQQQQQSTPSSSRMGMAGALEDFDDGFDNVATNALLSLFAAPSSASSIPSTSTATAMPTVYAAPFHPPAHQQPPVPSRKRPYSSASAGDSSGRSINGGGQGYGGEQAKRARLLSGINFSDAPMVYTDGACSKNGSRNPKAGYGVWWGDGHADNACGPVYGDQTNNRAELMGVIKAIDTAQQRGLSKLIVRTDSQLLINSMNSWVEKWKRNGWKTADGKPVKNQDLLQILDAQLDRIPVLFEHVPGHAGVHGNEMADGLARHAAAEVSAGRMRIPDGN